MEIEFGKYYSDDELQAATAAYSRMSDRELVEFVRGAAQTLGHPPKKTEIPAYWAIKQRLGPWPRVLVKAGLKEPSAHYIHRKDGRRIKKQQQKKDPTWEQEG